MIIKTVFHTAVAVITAEIVHKVMQDYGWDLLKKGYDALKEKSGNDVNYVEE